MVGEGAATSAKASRILMKDEAELLKVKAEIDAGASFAEKAKEHSTCPSGKNEVTSVRSGQGGWFKSLMTLSLESNTRWGCARPGQDTIRLSPDSNHGKELSGPQGGIPRVSAAPLTRMHTRIIHRS